MKEMLQNKAIICVGVLLISIPLFTNLAMSTGNESVSNDDFENIVVVEKSL